MVGRNFSKEIYVRRSRNKTAVARIRDGSDPARAMNTLKSSSATQIAKEQKNAQLNTNNGVKIKNN